LINVPKRLKTEKENLSENSEKPSNVARRQKNGKCLGRAPGLSGLFGAGLQRGGDWRSFY